MKRSCFGRQGKPNPLWLIGGLLARLNGWLRDATMTICFLAFLFGVVKVAPAVTSLAKATTPCYLASTLGVPFVSVEEAARGHSIASPSFAAGRPASSGRQKNHGAHKDAHQESTTHRDSSFWRILLIVDLDSLKKLNTKHLIMAARMQATSMPPFFSRCSTAPETTHRHLRLTTAQSRRY